MRFLKRDIPDAPGYEITRDGQVRRNSELVIPEVRSGPNGARLTVRIEDTWVPVWVIMSRVWYQDAVLMHRDGNPMDFHHLNLFALHKVAKLADGSMPTAEQIRDVWKQYQQMGKPVSGLAEATGLLWPVKDFENLVRSILAASIRL